ncbi:hypothetical protein ABIC63_005697 [Pseudacidovorax sp. 1753]|uniref:hypothetical protein n=1 Tax=Pseudacidovorax sp. 1753 TaxID=3156419 RepID=UPI003394D646
MAISTLLDHFKAIKDWASSNRAKVNLDVESFELEIRCANRYYNFFPQFSILASGQLAYTRALTSSAQGFCGWRPYVEYKTPLTVDKVLFKRYFSSQGLKVPAAWEAPEECTGAYILKPKGGSFGEGIQGPFKPGQGVDRSKAPGDALFADQFIVGRSVKVWLWGEKPVCADIQEWPCIVGDGSTSIDGLIENRLYGPGGSRFGANVELTEACLRFQGFDGSTVLDLGRSAWIDFRYGRNFLPPHATRNMPNRLSDLEEQCGAQLASAGAAVARALRQVVPAPVVSSIDAVMDERGALWWLELNSNPLFPHHGYNVMLDELFARAVHS